MHVLVFLLFFATLQEGDPSPFLEAGRTVQGMIDDKTPFVETEKLLKKSIRGPTRGVRHLLRIAEAGTYTIELRSIFIDGYLVLRDTEGNVLFENDDGLYGKCARIVFEADGGKEYRLDACSLNGLVGEYELLLWRGEKPELTSREKVQALLSDGERFMELLKEGRIDETREAAESLENLAVALTNHEEDKEGMSLFDKALSIRKKVLVTERDDSVRLLLNIEIGRQYEAKYNFKEAIPYLRQALSLFKKPHSEKTLSFGECLFLLGRSLYEIGNSPEALPYLEQSLAIYMKICGPEHKRTIWNREVIGMTLVQLRKNEEALQYLEHVCAEMENISSAGYVNTGQAFHAVISAYINMGYYEKAQLILENALEIEEKNRGPESYQVVNILGNLGLVLRNQGKLKEARPILERVLSITENNRGPKDKETAIAINNLASLYSDLSNYDESLRLFERELSINKEVYGPDHAETAKTILRMAGVLDNLGKHEKAKEYCEISLSIFERTYGPENPIVGYALFSLAQRLIYSKKFMEAKPHLERALAIIGKLYPQNHRAFAFMYRELAKVYAFQGNYIKARDYIEQAYTIFQEIYGLEHSTTLGCLWHMVTFSMDVSNYDTAWEFVQQYVTSKRLERNRTLGSLSEYERMIYMKDSIWDMNLLLSVADKIEIQEAIKKAYEFVVYWKGPVYRSMIKSRESDDRNMNPEVEKIILQLRNRQSQISKILFKKGENDEENHELQIDALRRECLGLERELSRHSEIDSLHQSIHIPDLQRALPESAALIDFYLHRWYEPAQFKGDKLVKNSSWTDHYLSAWILRKDNTDLIYIKLGSLEKISQAVFPFFEEIHAFREMGSKNDMPGDGSRLKETNDGIRSLLWDPLIEHLDGVDTIFISPDFYIANIPFEVIMGKDHRYLVEDYSFIYVRDTCSLAKNRVEKNDEEKIAATKSIPRLLVVGDVDYLNRENLAWTEVENNTKSEELAHASGAVSFDTPFMLQDRFTNEWRAWNALPGTGRESEIILDIHERYFKEKAERLRLEGSSASEERVKDELPNYQIAHIATHGFFQPAWLPSRWAAIHSKNMPPEDSTDPWIAIEELLPGYLSGIVLAGANNPPDESRDDGLLTAEELSWLNLSDVDLVVLSACKSGLGTFKIGEGLIGLNRSLMQAGVDSVISSLWKVSDEATMLLFSEFYRYLWEEGLTPAKALRQVKLDMIHGKLTAKKAGIDRGADVTEAKSIDISSPFHWGAFLYWGDGE